MGQNRRSYGTIEEEKFNLEVALQGIEKICTDGADSQFTIIVSIANALKDGDKLVGTPLDSVTNYAYKIYLQGQPEVALFCKVCLPYAIWDSKQSPLDLARVENEFEALRHFSDIMGKDAPVTKPLFCLDPGAGMKILVCEYVSNAEKWIHQFAKGNVDERVVLKAAEAIALLNASHVDPYFNDNVRTLHYELMEIGKPMIEKMALSTGDGDKAVLYFRQLGAERCISIMAAMQEHYFRREVFLHNEYVLVNTMVEASNPQGSSDFSPGARLFICDMEQALCGPVGKDVGSWKAVPIAYAFLHASGGHKDEAFHILDCCVQFFDDYAKTAMRVSGKDEDFLKYLFRSSLGWISFWTSVVMYLFHPNESLPIDGVSVDGRAKAKASAAYTGFRFAEVGFLNLNPDLTLQELRAFFKKTISDEISELLSLAESNMLHVSESEE